MSKMLPLLKCKHPGIVRSLEAIYSTTTGLFPVKL
ncbi:hypothetical protein T11_6672 [Trichinella zimbabwensis]|uniref:Uncharacterized protein n=1 Tax=Trichinella zimbabwensis TaxID=268475 RepID=A0A0V1GY45_9BILA|nr:hypothetical protein T11_6672 [Trichinella zimbabwensis]